jgi:hypothetical protein
MLFTLKKNSDDQALIKGDMILEKKECLRA